MGGIYGTALPVFTEQGQTYSYFNMTPSIDSGYTTITGLTPIYGILRLYSAPPTAEGEKVRMAEGNLVTQRAPFFWTESRLTAGWFLATPMIPSGTLIVTSATDVYRLMTDNQFDNAAGMYVYGLNKLVGDNGLTVSSLNYDFGTGSFA